MTIKIFTIFIFFTFLTSKTVGQIFHAENINNPTGSYKLISNAKTRNGEIYGYYGFIKVKLLNRSRIVTSFYVSKGAPTYTSGSFLDTLEYEGNKAVYKTEDDKSCKLSFEFSDKGIVVEEIAKDYNSACGFGHGVTVNGRFKKTSSKTPIIKNPLIDL